MPSSRVQGLYIDLQLQTAKFKAAIGEAEGSMRKMQSQMREEMAKSRESVRLLNEELGVGMPRGLTNIVAKLPGVASALNLAFDAVVVFALIKTVVEAGKKIEEFANKSKEAAEKHREAWETTGRTLRNTNDDLQLANTKLENAIAKLEHKPQNGIKEAIDDAISSADKLGEKLTADLKLIIDTQQGQEVSGLNSFFTGSAKTGDINDRNKALRATLDSIDIESRDHLEALRKQNATESEIDAVTAYYNQKRINAINAERDWSAKELASARQRQAAPLSFNQTMNTALVPLYKRDDTDRIQQLTSRLANLGSVSDFIGYSQRNTTLTNTQTKLTQQLADQKQADQDRLKAFQQAFENEKNQFGMSVAQERAYWESKLSAFKKGSDEYLAVLARYTQANLSLHKQLQDIIKSTLGSPTSGFQAVQIGNQDQLSEAIAKGKEQQASLAAAMAETTARINEQHGAITKLASANIIAAAHTAEFNSKEQALKNQLTQLRDNSFSLAMTGNLSTDEQTREQGIKNQLDSLNSQRSIQVITDSQIEKASTLKGGLDDLFDTFEARTLDVGHTIEQSFSQAINTTNDAIIKVLTTRDNRGTFSEAGKQIFTGFAKTGLESAEGGVMKMLGLGSGKLGGSPSNAMWVRNVEALAGKGIGTIASAVSTATSASGGFFTSLFTGLGKFAGMLSVGGPMSPGDWAVVGERGPELLQVGSSSRVYSNSDSRAMSDSSGGIHFHAGAIDARGAIDPVAVRRQVMQGIQDAAPHLMKAQAKATSAQQRRLPMSSHRS